MLNKKLIIITTILLILSGFSGHAQDGALEEYFFESGKIKVVIAVAAVIGIGIFLYLFRLDKKIEKLEKKDS